jgi:hypothetical protein
VVLRTHAVNFHRTHKGDKATYLIRHYHELTIPQALDVRIVLVVLKTHDFFDVLDLLVLHDLVVLRLAHVQELAAQREDTKVVASNNAETGHRKRLGGVTFGQNERTLGCGACPCIVRIRKLGDASETAKRSRQWNRWLDESRLPVAFRAVSLFDLLIGPELCPIQDVLDNR